MRRRLIAGACLVAAGLGIPWTVRVLGWPDWTIFAAAIVYGVGWTMIESRVQRGKRQKPE